MEIENATEFSGVNGLKTDEVFGSIQITIEPGTFCLFDDKSPSNGLHYHNCYEICLVTGGTGEFRNGKEIYRLHEGCVFIANPGVVHEIRLANGNDGEYVGDLHLVFFQCSIISKADTTPIQYEEMMLRQFLTNHNIITRTQYHLFAYLGFIRDYNGASSGTPYGLTQASIKFCLECLFSLVQLENGFSKKVASSDNIVDKAISYILTNIHRRIYLDDIAAHVCFSERNLQLVFKKQMKKTISEYINERKTATAAGYLKMNFKVGEVSNIVGINDVAQFSRLFKRYYGVSPKKYQSIYSSV